MPRTDDEVVEIFLEIYEDEFGGKEGQRFTLSWRDLRSIYGYKKLFDSRIRSLAEAAGQADLYVFDLGAGLATGKGGDHMLAVIKTKTVDKWRRLPEKILCPHVLAIDEDEENAEEEDE